MPLGQPFLGEFKYDTEVFIYLLFISIYSVNIKPPGHRFGFSLAWGWQNLQGV